MNEQERDRLRKQLERQARRMKRAERGEAPTFLYIGTAGLLFVLPVVGGAYLGSWLDEKYPGYSIHWTLSMIFLGLIVGAINVWLFLRE